ncbi:hypothetical protein D0962_37850 [Leptolyngbyaceae cyanobacterium CCMR0082]|uniref:Uncharacterized protein n=1 Tax=Adonisia turfae CCMR0082 TaxID=2304604 RepID=A0A6M0SIV7_9CYAN|nr:hypothetical protein [Adonisia turfae]NEZ68417.1 hypothetical protein [Adonisia turfae CCMR0082]
MKVWILGFDGACSKCTRLARQIQKISNQKLGIESLHSPKVKAWRQSATGRISPLVPTLFEVEDEHVKSYTGIRMTTHLLSILGPLDAGRVLWALGQQSSFVDHPISNDRRHLFKTFLGGVAATSLISLGKAPFSRPAAALEEIKELLESANVEAATTAESQQHLAIADGNAKFRKLRNYVEQNNFSVFDDPDVKVITVGQESPSVASVQKYVTADNKTIGELIFIRRPNNTIDSCLTITNTDENELNAPLPYSLYVDDTGAMKSVTYDQVVDLLKQVNKQQSSVSCQICTVICSSSTVICPLGAVAGCAIVCSQLGLPLGPCQATCVPIFSTICLGCRFNICAAICAAPLPR